MVGLELPVSPLEHHYLITETIPEVAALKTEMPMVVDLEGLHLYAPGPEGHAGRHL